MHSIYKTTIKSYKARCASEPMITGTIEDLVAFFNDSQTCGHIWSAESSDIDFSAPDKWSYEKPWIVSYRDADYGGFRTAEEALRWHCQTSEDYSLDPHPSLIGG